MRRSTVLATALVTVTLLSCDASTAAWGQQTTNDKRAPLRTDIEYLASDDLGGRATGTPGNEKARIYLTDRLAKLGAKPWFDDELVAPFEFESRGQRQSAFNVVGWYPSAASGQRGEKELIVMTAHYDHLGRRGGKIHNGADDNASGVSALLAIAERLRETPTKHDVLIALLDAEELGLRGARHLADALDAAGIDVVLNINLDMVGRSDKGALYVAGLAHYPQLQPVVDAAAKESPITIKQGHDTGGGPDDWTHASDHAAFHRKKIPFLYLGVEDHADYHRPTDDPEKIDFDFLAATIDFTWRTLLDFDGRN